MRYQNHFYINWIVKWILNCMEAKKLKLLCVKYESPKDASCILSLSKFVYGCVMAKRAQFYSGCKIWWGTLKKADVMTRYAIVMTNK